MSSLKEKTKTLMDMEEEAEQKCWKCKAWATCSDLTQNEGRECDIRNPLVVKLEDVEQILSEIKHRLLRIYNWTDSAYDFSDGPEKRDVLSEIEKLVSNIELLLESKK
jgi:hypothetical protein